MRPVTPAPLGRCLFPTPANVYPLTGIGSCKPLLEHRAPPGRAPTRIIMLVNDGGTATQPKAPGHDRSFTASAGAAKHGRLRAAHLAPGQERPHAALRAARPGRPRAATRAPGTDVPPATTAGAPGQYRLRAAHQAPGHDRPFTASAGAAKHGRPRAATRAPGADVPPATAAEAPGQHRLRAAHLAPGQERPHAALRATWPDRPRAATRAPGADVPPATAAEAPGQYRLCAVAIATVALPAGQSRLRQEDLPHTPANPRTPTHSPAHQHSTRNRLTVVQALPSPCTAGGPQGGQIQALPSPRIAGGLQGGQPPLLPLSKCWRGGRGVRPITNQVQPAIQVPPHPRPCSTADTGLHHHHPSRAPPPRHCGGSRHPDALSQGERAGVRAGVRAATLSPCTAGGP